MYYKKDNARFLKVPILFSQHEHRTLTGQKLYFKRVLPLFSKPSLGVGFETSDGSMFNPVVTGGQIEFTRTGGGLFTFDSFQLANQLSGISRGISWTGQVNGVDTQSLTGVSTNSGTFSTQNVNFSGAVALQT
jgi:hypothetical protein